MVEPLTVAELGAETLKWIKGVVQKKIKVTPGKIFATARQWDSRHSLIIQNRVEQPLFKVQVVCWFSKDQDIIFLPHHSVKEVNLEGITTDTAFFLVRGILKNGQNFYLMELGKLMPKESVEVDLQIHHRGELKFEPVSYDKKVNQPILVQGNKVAIPLTPFKDFKLISVSLMMRKNNN